MPNIAQEIENAINSKMPASYVKLLRDKYKRENNIDPATDAYMQKADAYKDPTYKAPMFNNNSQTDAIRKAQERADRRIEAQTNQAVNQLQGTRQGIENNFDEATKQAYARKLITDRQMMEKLANQGIVGGMQVSAMTDLSNNYNTNVNNLIKDKADTLNKLAQDIETLKATGDIERARSAQAYYDRLAQAEIDQDNTNYNRDTAERQYADEQAYRASLTEQQRQQYDDEKAYRDRVYSDTRADTTTSKETSEYQDTFNMAMAMYNSGIPLRGKYAKILGLPEGATIYQYAR